MTSAFLPLVGLFVAAFLAATLLPAQSEGVLAAMIVSNRYDLSLLILVATVGNWLGSCANWLLGRSASRFVGRSWFPLRPRELARACSWFERWGWWSLLLSWAPVVGDGLTLAAGILRMPFLPFSLIVLLAKGGRYLALAGLLWPFTSG